VTSQIALTLAVGVGALALFIWNRLRVDVVGLLVMAAVIVLGLVTPAEGIAGFANEATVTVALMLVLSTGLLRTGVVDIIARWTTRLAGKSEVRLLAVVIALVIPVSAFLNNTAAVAILLPMLLGFSRTMAIAPSRILMPLSFASQLGGTTTLIGTSTNLLVAGLVLEAGLGRIGLFEITPPALILTVLGAIYMLTLGRWLTPVRVPPQDILETYELREYLTALVVGPESPLVGRTLGESRFGDAHGLQVVRIQRGEERLRSPDARTVVEANDVLVVTGRIPDIAQIGEVDHLRISGSRPALDDVGGGAQLAEVLVRRDSEAIGRTLRELDFRARRGITALGLQREGHVVHAPVGRVPLRAGDILLVQGATRALRELHEEGDFALLGPVRVPAKRRRKAARAVAIMIGVVILPALGVTTILVSALAGVAAMLLTGCITADEAYEEMDWSVIVLLGTILPLGIAMQKSGAASWIAEGFLGVAAPLGPHGVLATLYCLTTVLTSVISNNAAAVVLTPIAIATGGALGVSPLPFIIGVMFAASNSFVTPIGYQTNAFIFGPGGYRFGDFVRVGGPLNLLLVGAATVVIPWFFPF
jgi:di/tricarboxylate transporter